jgi:hypothetical protein
VAEQADKQAVYKLELLVEVAEVPRLMAEPPIMAGQALLVRDFQVAGMVALLLLRMAWVVVEVQAELV